MSLPLIVCPETSVKSGKQGTSALTIIVINITATLFIFGIRKYIFDDMWGFQGEEDLMYVVFYLLFLWRELDCFDFENSIWVSIRNFRSAKVRKNVQPCTQSLSGDGSGVYFLGKTS